MNDPLRSAAQAVVDTWDDKEPAQFVKAIKALRAELEKPQPEPVAEVTYSNWVERQDGRENKVPAIVELKVRTLERELSALRVALADATRQRDSLLARIFRDGGQTQDAFETRAEACEAADRLVAAYISDAERLDWLASRHDDGDEQWFVYGATSGEPLRAAIDKEMK